jgi:L-malate glycosyltransferase
MNILELCTSKGWGGLELYALEVMRHVQFSTNHCYAAIRPATLLSERLDSAIPRLYLKPVLRILPLLAAWRLARFIERHEVDVIHAHWNKDLILAVLAKRLSQRKVKLLFIRHMAITRHKGDRYHRFIYNNIDRYLVITKKLHAEARQFLPIDPSRLEVLYHGVAALPQSGDAAACGRFFAEQRLAPGRFSILLPGRIEPYKGQHVLIEAIAGLRDKGYSLQALIMGHVMDTAYFDSLQKLVTSRHLSACVHFAGFVEKPQQFYACFDVVVLTTTSETFGLVLVEAMQAGVAVIGTDAGGVPEIIKHDETGLLFKPEDAVSLADALRVMLDAPDNRKRMAVNGQQFAREAFSRERHFSRLDAIFLELTR